MIKTHLRWSYLTIFAFVGSFLYITLTAVSISYYPGPFGPLTNYLSQLGNSSLNPEGAIFYNLALFCTGISVIPATIAIYKFYSNDKNKKILVSVVICGFFNGLSIVMAGVFNEDFSELHFIWSMIIFLTLIPLLFLTNIGLWNHQDYSRSIGLYGLSLGIFDMIFVAYVVIWGTNSGAILEWITIFVYISWFILVSIQILYRERNVSN
ncbi:MAG: DUF998 domain-containing protein [Candidatus Thorarchaeota archaeon]